jgi:hypothetical protein
MVFKRHPEFSNYEVSETGIVRSLPHIVPCKSGYSRVSPGTVLKPKYNKDGYASVALYVSNVTHHKRVARLVLETFVGVQPALVCRHKNDVRNDDRLSNLEWGTSQDNSTDMVKRGRAACGLQNGAHTKPDMVRRGALNGGAKITETDVERIRDVRRNGVSYGDLVKWFGVSKSQIARICTGHSWTS